MNFRGFVVVVSIEYGVEIEQFGVGRVLLEVCRHLTGTANRLREEGLIRRQRCTDGRSRDRGMIEGATPTGTELALCARRRPAQGSRFPCPARGVEVAECRPAQAVTYTGGDNDVLHSRMLNSDDLDDPSQER